MPLEERKERWRAMMDVLERNNVEDWSKSFLDILLEDQPQPVNGRVMPPLWTTLDG
jgi:trehalose-6-phosphate synthase